MRVRESFKEERWLIGQSEIFDYLKLNNMINMEFLNEHYEFTKEAILISKSGLQKILEEIFEYPLLAWQIHFNLRISEFSKQQNRTPIIRALRKTFSWAILNTFKSFKKNIKRNGIQFSKSSSTGIHYFKYIK